MFEEFEKGTILKDLVEEILREGPRSISQVGRALVERGVKLHRLALAGYLKALADDGVLQEEEIPPAKVYRLAGSAQQRDLFASLAQRCRSLATTEPEAARLYLQTLLDLFHRPIFREELKRGGFELPRGATEVPPEERQTARRYLSRGPFKLPFNDPAYRFQYGNDAEERSLREASRNLLAALVRDDFHVAALAMTSKQVTLGSDA